MISLKSLLYNLFIAAIVFSQFTFSQVIFRDLPNYKINTSDQLFFDITETRDVISLNGKWKVYPADDEKKEKVSVTVPSIFEGKGEFVFEKNDEKVAFAQAFEAVGGQVGRFRIVG